MTSILKYLIILGISANVTILAAQKSNPLHPPLRPPHEPDAANQSS